MKRVLDLNPINLQEEPSVQVISINSMCMSIRGIKMVEELLHEKVEALKTLNAMYARWVSSIKFFTNNRQTGDLNSGNVFVPTPKTFKADPVVGVTFSPADFKSADFYVILQETSITVSAPKPSEDAKLHASEKWQDALSRLLLEVDLSSYHNSHPVPDAANENSMCSLMRRIASQPGGFVASSNLVTRIALLAHRVAEGFAGKDEEFVAGEVAALRGRCRAGMVATLQQNQAVEQSIRAAINDIGNRLTALQEEREKYVHEQMAGIVAGYIIKTMPVLFRLSKEKLTASKAKSKTPEKSMKEPYSAIITKR